MESIHKVQTLLDLFSAGVCINLFKTRELYENK